MLSHVPTECHQSCIISSRAEKYYLNSFLFFPHWQTEIYRIMNTQRERRLECQSHRELLCHHHQAQHAQVTTSTISCLLCHFITRNTEREKLKAAHEPRRHCFHECLSLYTSWRKLLYKYRFNIIIKNGNAVKWMHKRHQNGRIHPHVITEYIGISRRIKC